jgi:hypothetical protein
VASVIEAFKSPARVLYGRQSRLKLADKGSIGSLALLIFDFFNDIDPKLPFEDQRAIARHS